MKKSVIALLVLACFALSGCTIDISTSSENSKSETASVPNEASASKAEQGSMKQQGNAEASGFDDPIKISSFTAVGKVSGENIDLVQISNDEILAFQEAICYAQWSAISEDSMNQIGGTNLLNASDDDGRNLLIWKDGDSIYANVSQRINDSLQNEYFSVPSQAEKKIALFLNDIMQNLESNIVKNFDNTKITETSLTAIQWDYSEIEGARQSSKLTKDESKKLYTLLAIDKWKSVDINLDFGLTYLAIIENGVDFNIFVCGWKDEQTLIVIKDSSHKTDCYLVPDSVGTQIETFCTESLK